MAADEEAYAMTEEKDAKMVPFLNSNETIYRKGYFLKPISDPSGFSFCSSFIFPEEATEKPKIQFKGWTILTNWKQWVKKLKPIYKELWKDVGILDAIDVSTFKLVRDSASFFEVCRFWCGETNTFLFPWGEATVTLEDVMILGGYSVLGECVLTSKNLEGGLLELENKMLSEVRRFNKSTFKKAFSSGWVKHFLEKGNCDELEHIAFLTLWLTDFVFPSHPFKTINKKVIPLAIRLARGVRIALAPAVLASIYRDMREIKAYLCSNKDRKPLDVWAPLYILQLWVWERFPSLQPQSNIFVNSHEPRGVRWHDTTVKLMEDYVLSIIMSQEEMDWRPYIASLDHWRKPSYHLSDGRWIDEVVDEGIASYIRCLRACELVSMDCIEQYLPHRVARQFGYDQEIPCIFPRACSKWEIAWQTYEFDVSNVKLYVPPKLFRSYITLEYSEWWDDVQKLAMMKKYTRKMKKSGYLRSHAYKKLEEVMDKEKEMDEIPLSVRLDDIKKKLRGCDDVSLYSFRACKNTKNNADAYDNLGTTSSWFDVNSSLKNSEPQTVTENLEKCMELEPSSKIKERLVICNSIESEHDHCSEPQTSTENLEKCMELEPSSNVEEKLIVCNPIESENDHCSEPQTSTGNLEKCMESEPCSKVEERLVTSNPTESKNNHSPEPRTSTEDSEKCMVLEQSSEAEERLVISDPTESENNHSSEPQTGTQNLEKYMELEPSSKVEDRLVICNPIESENNNVCDSKKSLESRDITKCEVIVLSDSDETIDRDGDVSISEGEIEVINVGETVYEPEVENDESSAEKIRRLKEEIAIIHAKVMELEAKEAGNRIDEA